MARSVRRSVDRGPRRKRVWVRRNYVVGALSSAGASSIDLGSDFELVAGQSFLPVGSTVLRTRISLGVVRTAGVETAPHFHFGVLVGPTTLDADDMNPAVSTNFHLDWMLWRKMIVRNDTAGFQTAFELDVKAMRKLEELQSTVWAVHGTITGDTYTIIGGVSTLLALP